jgi:hypothetical protein
MVAHWEKGRTLRWLGYVPIFAMLACASPGKPTSSRAAPSARGSAREVVTIAPPSTASGMPSVRAEDPIPKVQLMPITRRPGIRARLQRTASVSCGGILPSDAASADEAMLEALFDAKDSAYASDGSLVVGGTVSYAEVAAQVLVRDCAGGPGGDSVPQVSARNDEGATPLVPAAWKKAIQRSTFGSAQVAGYSAVVEEVPDPSWKIGADQLRLVWAELSTNAEGRSSGLLAIVGRYGNSIKVLALGGDETVRRQGQGP